ncbi:ABC transporter permease, partial [Candidatus Nomurabacteria bacterium]|nr:ABC transporter permease [Candidatus Nomurabacteria bacterium]
MIKMLLAWKEIRHSKKKYVLIELILVLLIFMVLFLSGLTNGLGRAVSATISNMPAESFVLSRDSEDMLALSNVDEEQYEAIQKQSDGDTAGFSIFRSTVSTGDDAKKLNVIYFGVQTDKFLNPETIEGKQLSEGTHEIVLDSSFEENGISIGDVIRDSATDYEYTVVGFAKDAMYSHVAAGFISSESFEEMRKDSIPGYELSYNAIAVRGVADVCLDNMEVLSKDEVIQELPGYAAEQMTIQMILWVLLVISAVILGI